MRPQRLLLQDMADAIDEVLRETPATQATFDSNKFLRSHLLRQIQIIGEAAWRLPDDLKAKHPDVARDRRNAACAGA